MLMLHHSRHQQVLAKILQVISCPDDSLFDSARAALVGSDIEETLRASRELLRHGQVAWVNAARDMTCPAQLRCLRQALNSCGFSGLALSCSRHSSACTFSKSPLPTAAAMPEMVFSNASPGGRSVGMMPFERLLGSSSIRLPACQLLFVLALAHQNGLHQQGLKNVGPDACSR